jgi:high-affinity iron transporter
MLIALLLTLREGIEAALIVGIVFGYLRKVGALALGKWAWLGVGLAVGLSVGLATLIIQVGAELEGPAEQIFEGTTMILAVGVLTWMIFWMRSEARHLKTSLETGVQEALTGGAAWGLFALTFLAVFREGVETALFLGAAALQASALDTLIGGIMGMVLAVLLGYGLYASSLRLNLRLFFDITSLILLVFAAGLFMHSIHEFQEVGWLPEVIAPLWDTSHLIAEDSIIGQFLRALMGYTPTPSLVEIVAYVGYWLITLGAVRWWVNRAPASPTTAATR